MVCTTRSSERIFVPLVKAITGFENDRCISRFSFSRAGSQAVGWRILFDMDAVLPSSGAFDVLSIELRLEIFRYALTASGHLHRPQSGEEK